MKFISTSEQATAAFAASLAEKIKPGTILCLWGDLGAGKTVFSRALIRALSVQPDLEVPSPTFTLLQLYELDKTALRHFDLYRLEDAEEIFELGWEDGLSESITLVEWPERLGDYLPKARLDVRITPLDGDQRKIEVTAHEA